MDNDLIAKTGQSLADKYAQDFTDYGMLLNSMTPEELAPELGRVFASGRQCAVVSMLLGRIMALEARLEKLDA